VHVDPQHRLLKAAVRGRRRRRDLLGHRPEVLTALRDPPIGITDHILVTDHDLPEHELRVPKRVELLEVLLGRLGRGVHQVVDEHLLGARVLEVLAHVVGTRPLVEPLPLGGDDQKLLPDDLVEKLQPALVARSSGQEVRRHVIDALVDVPHRDLTRRHLALLVREPDNHLVLDLCAPCDQDCRRGRHQDGDPEPPHDPLLSSPGGGHASSALVGLP
jgi:hypothetical protein